MEIEVYDTGRNWLLAQRFSGMLVRGLVVDKFGLIEEDLEGYEDAPRLGSMQLGLDATEKLARKSTYLATYIGGELKRKSIDALENEEFLKYASLQREG